MSIGHTTATTTAVELEVAAGTGFSLLVQLAAAAAASRKELPAEVAAALDDVGDAAGELWLNLFGVPLDAGSPYDVDGLLAALAATDPVELRRQLLGRYAWSWCTLGGVEDIESAAAGDTEAASRLLAAPRYYAGHAPASLSTLLTLDPEETQRRIRRAVDVGAETLLDPTAARELHAAQQEAEETIAAHAPLTAIERLATGFRYVPEPEAERVVLIPHLEHRLALVLAQHRSARLVVYPAHRETSRDRLLALGRALADPKRVEILALVGGGLGRAPDLVAETGLSRSTVHHHLAQLREVGLVALEGNARAYTYVPRRDAAAEAARLVAEIVGTEEER